MTIERIEHAGRVVAFIVRKDFRPEGINFLTPDDYPLQFAISTYQTGAVIKSHIHVLTTRVIETVQEVVFIDRGMAEVTIYDESGAEITVCTLNQGDVIFFASGGHGFRMMEDTVIMEVKQGPYLGIAKEKKFIQQ